MSCLLLCVPGNFKSLLICPDPVLNPVIFRCQTAYQPFQIGLCSGDLWLSGAWSGYYTGVGNSGIRIRSKPGKQKKKRGGKIPPMTAKWSVKATRVASVVQQPTFLRGYCDRSCDMSSNEASRAPVEWLPLRGSSPRFLPQMFEVFPFPLCHQSFS